MLPMEAQSLVEAYAAWIGFVGAATGVVGVALAIYFYLRPHRSKRLGWEYESWNQIIQVPASERDQLPLKVVYGEKDVANPNVIVLRISNAGQQSIGSGDFDQPISVEFPSSHLLAANVVGIPRPNVEVSLNADTSDASRVTVNPFLLNTGEAIKLQFVTDGIIELPRVDARIAGETHQPFDLRQSRANRSSHLADSGLAASVLVLFILGIVYLRSGIFPSVVKEIIFVVIVSPLFWLIYKYRKQIISAWRQW